MITSTEEYPVIIMGSFSPVLHKKHVVGTQKKYLSEELLKSIYNISRVDRKTVASQMVVFPNT